MAAKLPKRTYAIGHRAESYPALRAELDPPAAESGLLRVIQGGAS